MMKEGKALKKSELQILSQLMMNGRISDRALGKKVGVSQPTVSRIRARLEKEGYIREYAAIPNVAKLGYEILAITFVKSKSASAERGEEARRASHEILAKGAFNIIMIERGAGLSYDAVVFSYHENYSSYTELLKWLKQSESLAVEKTDNYLIDLRGSAHSGPMTFKTLAQHLMTTTKQEGKSSK